MNRPASFVLTAALAGCFILTHAGWGQIAKTETSEILETTVGRGLVVTLSGDVGRIALVDESVARVQILGRRELLVHGLKIGRTSLFVWPDGGQRLHYLLKVNRDLELLSAALRDLDANISVKESPDGQCVLLSGNVPAATIAEEAVNLAGILLKEGGKDKASILNLLRYPSTPVPMAADRRLAEALKSIDPRITVRRMQVADTSDANKDSYVLEGRVRTVADLLRAVTLAERQLGGMSGEVKAPEPRGLSSTQARGIQGGRGGSSGLQSLRGQKRPAGGLAAQVSRGLVVASDSGRVISFLKVDNIYQILVSTRVLEIDRVKARALGINYRIDGKSFSLGSYTGPQTRTFPSLRGAPASVSDLVDGNLVGAYVGGSLAILSAVDFLQNKAVARSVAEPNVMTLTGEQASVVVGGEVPIPTTAVGEVAAVQGFTFQSFGVRLDIRPTVGENDIITLEVAPSIVRPDEGLNVDGVPGFKVQSVQTTARVQAGESLVLGGLLSYEEVLSERKLPILGDLPVFRTVFKWSRKSREERELLFVITPRIMGQDEALDIATLAVLPELDSRDFRLGAGTVPQVLTTNGIPSSWVSEPKTEAGNEGSKGEQVLPEGDGEGTVPVVPVKPEAARAGQQQAVKSGVVEVPQTSDDIVEQERIESPPPKQPEPAAPGGGTPDGKEPPQAEEVEKSRGFFRRFTSIFRSKRDAVGVPQPPDEHVEQEVAPPAFREPSALANPTGGTEPDPEGAFEEGDEGPSGILGQLFRYRRRGKAEAPERPDEVAEPANTPRREE